MIELQQALQFHRSNQFAKAATIYRRILCSDPENADALHLLAMASLELGDTDESIILNGKAIACCPDSPVLHNAIGVCYQRADLHEFAVKAFLTAIELQNDLVDAHENLGDSYRAMLDWPQALREYRFALQLAPKKERLHRAVAEASRRTGCARTIIDTVVPMVLRDQANEVEILDVVERLIGCDELESVLRDCRDILERNSRNVSVNQFVGCVLASRLSTEHRAKLKLFEQRQLKQSAISCLKRAAAIRPSYMCQDLVGRTLLRIGEPDEAKSWLTKSIKCNPSFAPSHEYLGSALLSLGELPKARDAFREAVRLYPGSSLALFELARMGDDLPLTAIKEVLQSSASNDESRIWLNAAIGHRLIRAKRYDESMQHFVESGRIKTAKTRHEKSSNMDATPFIHAHSHPLTDLNKASPKVGQPTMIFIVGLPRSGTTLLEQILSCHSEVYGCGELNYVANIALSLSHRWGNSVPYPNAAIKLTEQQLSEMREEYVAEVEKDVEESLGFRRPDTTRYLIDKMPTNFRYVGLILQMFPDAKIIHMRRDLRDVAVSCLQQNLAWPFCHPESLAPYIREYVRLMRHYRELFGTTIHSVQYESLVENLSQISQATFRHLGLAWEPDCLKFFDSNRVVTTPSRLQVRQPIHNRSIGKWQNYESSLGKLFAQLQESDYDAELP